MKKILLSLHKAVITYFAWGWPIVAADAALEMWAGASSAPWRSFLNTAAFAWILCAPVAPITLLLDRSRRERAMARLCGLREDDERERVVTGEAARATLLLALSFQSFLLVMSLVNVHLTWNPLVPKGEKHGVLSVGFAFNSSQHLDPFGSSVKNKTPMTILGATPPASGSATSEFGGFLIAPSAFPILALLILIQVAAFKAFSGRRYEGADL